MTSDRVIYRHPLWVRITHWVNVMCAATLLMSGLHIFNAHPALYLGDDSRFDAPLAAIGAFPGWATLPGTPWLAMARRWHFFFAWLFVVNGAVYTLLALLRHRLCRALMPSLAEFRQIGRSLGEHLRLRFPRGEEARRYNLLQKLAYLVVICILCPAIVLTGLGMSPQLGAAWPWLLWMLGGRQSARTAHFVCAFSLLAFVIVHLLMVVLSGVWNSLRSMTTGWYDIGEADG